MNNKYQEFIDNIYITEQDKQLRVHRNMKYNSSIRLETKFPQCIKFPNALIIYINIFFRSIHPSSDNNIITRRYVMSSFIRCHFKL